MLLKKNSQREIMTFKGRTYSSYFLINSYAYNELYNPLYYRETIELKGGYK